MSEYDPATARKYTELMAPAFVEGFQDGICLDVPGLAPHHRVYLAQPSIIERLKQVAWEESDLPTKKWEGAETSLKPRDMMPGDYAERLMAFAFDDAEVLFKLCFRYEKENGLPEDLTMRHVLLNSKNTLLKVALLEDGDKRTVYRLLAHPEFSEPNLSGPPLPAAQDALVLGADKEGQVRFEWHPTIKSFIEDNVWEGRGCPAARFLIANPEGTKQPLLYFFWDKLVETTLA